MSEYEACKRIVKQMRLSKSQARDRAAKAFEADLRSGRPDIALKCAKEFRLADDYVTRAATDLFKILLGQGRFSKALEIARGYNLAHGGEAAQRTLQVIEKIKLTPGSKSAAYDEIKRLARRASSAQTEDSSAEEAIGLIKKAYKIRANDPRVQGRAVILPAEGEVWVTGDTHGNVENIKRFARLADLDSHPDRILVLQEIVHARLITADNRDLSFVAIMEAIRLMVRYPGRVYYLLGNHDLAVHLDRELVKAGKFLNRYLRRGMAYQYQDGHEEVLLTYRKFIAKMPAAVLCDNGLFMAHSTPKRPFIPSISRAYLTEESVDLPLSKTRPIAALVNGREYSAESADEFADQMECEVMLCGHTPTKRGWKRPNHRHLIIDSQHEQARFVKVDLSRRYATSEELAEGLGVLIPENEELEVVGELM